MKRRRTSAAPSLPWTPDEDATLAEITRIGLDCNYWHLALPARRFGEIAARRLDLRLPRARTI